MTKRRKSKNSRDSKPRKQHSKKKQKSASARYRHPVPDRGELLQHQERAGRPLSAASIARAFELRAAKQRQQLDAQLGKMAASGQLLKNRQGDYCLPAKLELTVGTVVGHPDGYGFITPEEGGERASLSAKDMQSLLDGDRVAFRTDGRDRRGRPRAKVVEMLERGVTEVAGQYIRERGIGVVIPDNPRLNHRFLVPKGEAGNAKPGQMVVIRVLDYPGDWQQGTGSVISVLGEPQQKGIATDLAIHSHGIPADWPRAVRDQASSFGKTVPTRAKSGRTDFRDTPLVTIDGADARDFDDAVFCEPTPSGWRLLVAIADVSHYVEIGAPIDKEAERRGTSVYFPDRVVPMLPEVLSNGLCSLNPKVDRLCMVCDMRVNKEGKVTRSTFVEGVMRSQSRLTYKQVSDFFDHGREQGIPEHIHQPLLDLRDLYRAFARRRKRRGAIELDLPQARIRMADDGSVQGIAAVRRNDAHRLIEECMIAANVEAAKFLKRHRINGLYRVHARPDPESFAELREYLLELGLKVPHPEHVKPADFSRIVRQTSGRADSAAISMTMLRSLPHAEYTRDNIGHFGLALESYAHFTSPIRRYPDLLVHRAIRHILRGGKAGNYRYSADHMDRLGTRCSAYERRAEEATREVEALLKCQFMEDRLGDGFSGTVTGVTHFGLFVQVDDVLVDGLVHVSSLDNDYYHFDAARMSLIGERSGKAYAIGDRLDVIVHRVDLETRRIDFRLAEVEKPRRRRIRR